MIADLLTNLALGFSVALSWQNLSLALVGCLVGTLIGVLPGIGPTSTIAMLLPLTFGADPVGGLIMLAGIYYGAQYGSSTTAILINVPGEVTSIVTTLDGHKMAQQGRAGAALGIAAIGSFIAGSIAMVFVAALAPPLTRLVLLFGPADYFALIVCGLLFTLALSRGSILNGVTMVLIGIFLSTIGPDVSSGQRRMTFSQDFLFDGIDIAALSIGLVGLAEVILNLERREARNVVNQAIGRVLPSLSEFRRSLAPIIRGTFAGGLLGLLPGSGAILGPFASYAMEKKLAADPSRFGRGAIEGVAGPEAANNAGAQTAFIPLLALGLPPNSVMALMVAAMMLHGITPGPQVMTSNPNLFWGLIASMWIGNVMLLIINLPLIGLWIRLLKIPYRLLFPAIVMCCCVGLYSVDKSASDVAMTGVFAIAGYVLVKFGFEATPLLLGFVLGRLMEQYLRRSLIMSRGDFSTFAEQPISASLLAMTVLMLLLALLSRRKAARAPDVRAD